jgi:hypothetical protein
LKRLIIVTFVGLTAAVSVAQFRRVKRLLDKKSYPKDAAKTEALKLCVLANPSFDRLDGDLPLRISSK